MKKFLLAATALTAMTAVASAADLPRRYTPPPAPAPVYVAPAFTWTGFYVGANAGGAVAGDVKTNVTGPGGIVGQQSDSAGGFLVGGTVGYNYQFHPNWVVGVEGDIGYADIQNRSTLSAFGSSSSYKTGIDGYFGTIRGRIGYAMGPWLFYGTGGWAFADGKTSSDQIGPGFASTTSWNRDLSGYVVGGGVEYAVSQNISLKAEYLYADFDKKRVVLPGIASASVSQDTHLLKVGVNYRFSAF